MKKIKIYSFFAGAGFLDLGFENAGYEIEFVNEYKKLLIEYYETDNTENIIKFIKEKCTTII